MPLLTYMGLCPETPDLFLTLVLHEEIRQLSVQKCYLASQRFVEPSHIVHILLVLMLQSMHLQNMPVVFIAPQILFVRLHECCVVRDAVG